MNTKALICLLACFGFSQLSAQVNSPKSENHTAEIISEAIGASMTFDAPHIDIGQIKQGDSKNMDFHFTNTGTEDLIIEIVSGCECTTLDWPRSPIKPGERGVVTALFDSTKKDKSETVEIDINLENIDPKSGYAMFERVSYTFELVK